MKRFIAPLLLILGLLLSGCTASGVPGPVPPSATTTQPTAQPSMVTEPPTDLPSLRPACQTGINRFFLDKTYAYLATGALYTYYQLGRSSDKITSDIALESLKSRYAKDALTMIEQRVSGWPMRVEVELPKVHLDSYVESSDCNTVTLHTTETWHVATQAQPDVYRETNQSHVVTMEKGAGIVTDVWFVTKIDG